jgi:hypothetical protein
VTDFSVNEDELFMGLLKRRAYMVTNPGALIPPVKDIVLEPQYQDDGCCGHDSIKLFVGKYVEGGITGKTLGHDELATFLSDYFGADVA